MRWTTTSRLGPAARRGNGRNPPLAMAVHKRVRQASRKLVAHVRAGRRALQGRRENRRHGRDSDADRINQRLSEIAAEVRAGNVYSVPWELFRFVALRQAPHNQAAVMLAAWCASSGLTPRLEARTVAIRRLPAPGYLPAPHVRAAAWALVERIRDKEFSEFRAALALEDEEFRKNELQADDESSERDI